MKIITILTLFLGFNVSQAAIKNLSLETLAGKYEATHPDIPVTNVIILNVHGDVQLDEISPYGTLKCVGKAELVNSILTSKVKCENNAEFEQRVNLSKVKNLNRFKAVVYSSLYGIELELNFKKLQ